jgi:hypothetical protein
MSQTSIVFKLGLIMALALIAAGIMMACETIPVPLTTTDSPAATEIEQAEAAPASPTTADGSPTAEAELADVPPPTPTTPPSPTPTPVVIAPDDGCENCHTDKEQLIATAKEEEVVEELSEGEG